MAQSISIQGKITVINPVQQRTEKLSIQEIEIEETVGNYPNVFVVQFVNNNVDILTGSGVKVGDVVSVECYLNGRRWAKRPETVFLSLSGFSIQKAGAKSNQQAMGLEEPAEIDDVPF